MSPIKKIFLYWLFCFPYSLVAQSTLPVNFQILTTENGLSHNNIKTIFQDSYGFIWIGTINGLNRYDGYEFKKYRYSSEDTTSLSSSSISHIWEDRSRDIWVATEAKGLNRFDRQTETFDRLPQHKVDAVHKNLSNREVLLSANRPNALMRLDLNTNVISPIITLTTSSCWEDGTVTDILKDQQGNFWFSNWHKLYYYETATQQLQCFRHQPNNPKSLSDVFTSTIFEDKQGNVWIGTANGLNLWNPTEANFKRIVPTDYTKTINNAASNYILSIEEDLDGNLWLGTGGGLLHYQTKTEKFTTYTSENSSLKLDAIYTLFMDKTGILWIGGETGLGILYPNYRQFDEGIHQMFGAIKDVPWNVHKGKKIFQSSDGAYWLPHMGGLYRIRKEGAIFEQQKILDGDFYAIYENTNQEIYAADLKKGIFKLQKDKIEHYLTADTNRIGGGYMYDLVQDHAGTFWMAAVGVLQRYHPAEDQFTYFYYPNTRIPDDLEIGTVLDLQVDKSGNLWLASLNGLFFLSKEELGKPYGRPLAFKHFIYEKDNPNSLSINNIYFIHETQNGEIWIGTENGLNHYENGQFTRYTEQLQGSSTYSILEDAEQNLWIGTSNGLFRLNTVSKTFTRFTKADGLPSNSFRFRNFLKDANGTLIFATEKGFISFNPKNIQKNEKIPPVFLTDFKLNNQSVGVGQKDALLKQPIYLTDELVLAHSQNVLTFQFSALNFLAPANNEYAYQLVGFDQDWQYIGNLRTATFTNLNAGDYVLKIKAANNDGVWNEKGTELKIKILPPWYQTWWAYMLWLSLGLGTIYGVYQFQLSRQLAQAEALRLQDLDKAKTNLYTNITHEFRTPLTVILGMAGQLNDQLNEKSVIQRNSHQLLSLVNQLLDLSKLKSGKLPLNLVQADLIPFLSYLMESFHSFAASKDIQLHYLPEVKHLYLDFDREKMQSILLNLLSNAIKFTPSKGSVYVQVRTMNDQQVQIQVRDTGQGIASSELPNIFNRFYQIETKEHQQGSGIGLALTKGLVELLEGSIQVESELGKGTIFSVLLPIKKTGTIQRLETTPIKPIPSTKSNTLPKDIISKELPTLLLVEDNEDLMLYLSQCLAPKYHLLLAQNGRIGIEKALALIPDIIISDVMMPEKNGLELCQTLKNEAATSHIPIILLTAKTDFEAKLEGLEVGADAYLAKPFQEKELFLRLEKLLALRQKLRELYTSSTFLEKPTLPANPEEVFLQDLRNVIETELTSPNLGIDLLCKKMALSRTALYNKVNALVGMPPGEYIRLLRLNHAKKLLLQTDLTITEIAYQCGFSSQSFFSRTFANQEGVSPSVFRGRNT